MIQAQKIIPGNIIGTRNNITIAIQKSNDGFNRILRKFYDVSGQEPKWIATKHTRSLAFDAYVGEKKTPVFYHEKITTLAPDNNNIARENIVDRYYCAKTKQKLVERLFNWQVPKSSLSEKILEKEENFAGWHKNAVCNSKVDLKCYGISQVSDSQGHKFYNNNNLISESEYNKILRTKSQN